MLLFANIINRLFQLAILLVIVDTLLSYFMDPFHPLRRTLDQIINPLLAPIRRIIPAVGGLDFSPLILIILLQVVDMLLFNLLVSF